MDAQGSGDGSMRACGTDMGPKNGKIAMEKSRSGGKYISVFEVHYQSYDITIFKSCKFA